MELSSWIIRYYVWVACRRMTFPFVKAYHWFCYHIRCALAIEPEIIPLNLESVLKDVPLLYQNTNALKLFDESGVE